MRQVTSFDLDLGESRAADHKIDARLLEIEMAYGDLVVSRECFSAYARGWDEYSEELNSSNGDTEAAYRSAMERSESHYNDQTSEQRSCENKGIKDNDQGGHFGMSLGVESCGY